MASLDRLRRQTIDIDSIKQINRLRAVDPKKVAELAESIREIGLMNPPAVRIIDRMMIDGEEVLGVSVLVHGAHRLAALQLLGNKFITCDVVDVDDLDAELMEIDENLRRANLGPAEDAAHVEMRRVNREKRRERDGISSGKIFPTGKVGYGSPPPYPKQFAAETAEVTGESKRNINQKLAVAKELTVPVLKRVAGTCLDSGVELKALTKLDQPTRETVIERAASGETVSARAVLAEKTPPSPDAVTEAERAAEFALLIPAEDRPAAASYLESVPVRALVRALRAK